MLVQPERLINMNDNTIITMKVIHSDFAEHSEPITVEENKTMVRSIVLGDR